jgi:hypothetical protein
MKNNTKIVYTNIDKFYCYVAIILSKIKKIKPI